MSGYGGLNRFGGTEGGRREHLIGALFSGDQHLSSSAVHWPPSTPPPPSPVIVSQKARREGRRGQRDERAALANTQGSDI